MRRARDVREQLGRGAHEAPATLPDTEHEGGGLHTQKGGEDGDRVGTPTRTPDEAAAADSGSIGRRSPWSTVAVHSIGRTGAAVVCLFISGFTITI